MKKKWLTINMYINAWLDCTNPFISIHNKYDDNVLAHFNTKKVKQLIDDGEISVADLQSNDPAIQMDIITDLIALQARETITKQITGEGLKVKRRSTEPTKKPKLNISELFPAPALRAV